MNTRLSLLLALSLSAVSANADTLGAIQLDNQKTSGQSVSGTCGPATVKVSDTTEDRPMDPSGFSGSYGAISIGSGKSALTISPQTDSGSGSGIFLQDRNKLHCLSSPTGPKLVLVMICHARSCAPIDYRVIDPKTTKVISKQDNMDECDAICATKALGAPLPAGLTDIP